MIKQFFYLAFWFCKAKFFNQKRPLQTIIFITDECNLSCTHCVIYNHCKPVHKSYSTIEKELRQSYRQGARFVDFEGGEPTLWRDNNLNINHLIDLAKQIGFFSCTITTNAQNDFSWVKADSIWVSMDGTKTYHDQVRGNGAFDNMERNIALCKNKYLSVNMVVNRDNYIDVKNAIAYAKENPHIQSIAINFITPFEGIEHMKLDWDKQSAVIDEVIAMKKQGYPIMNSYSGLKMMKKKHFKHYCWISNFIFLDGTSLLECGGVQLGLCDKCGYSMCGEMASVMHFKPDTLLAGLNLRVK
ncbi:MAG: radical SAM protein [Bacteroidales bacterium]|nr:radical SAM protein [Bacteroidales bacterium]